MQLNFDSIVSRVVEQGWQSRLELELVVDTIIEQDSIEYFEGKPGRLSETEMLFEYTGELRKKVIQRAVELAELDKPKDLNGDDNNA